ncbi:MAG: NAD(P)/FAD-dependent oxidoreductase [Tissierellia bacterium]|nr:NAD(P)/FAD-dependent oxidoreductase [Tissierellia bacterium]
MNSLKKYDLIVIGFGKAGKTLADKVASDGYSVAVIEKDNTMYGGTCINVGCLPTKSLVHRAKISESSWRINHHRTWEDNKQIFRDAIIEKDRMTTFLRGKNYQKLDTYPNVEIIDASASFENANEIKLVFNNGQEEIVEGKVIVINTGSQSRILTLPGFESNEHVHDSRSILNIHELPKRLAIIGAGYIGLEFASYFREFGSKVVVLQHDDRFLPREDSEDSAAVLQRLEKLGIQFIFNAKTNSLENITSKDDSELNLRLNYSVADDPYSIDVTNVLVAVGRSPLTDGLNLEAVGIETGRAGEVIVDDGLRTSVDNIFAVGDVKGGPQFTFISLDDFSIVYPQVKAMLENNTDRVINENHNRNNRPIYPNTTFIDPPYSRIGLSEEEAKAKYDNVKVKKMPAAAVPKAQVVQETDGFLKVIIDEETDLVLGAVLFCHESHEMINIFNLAINEGITATRLGQLIYNHPVMSEALNELLP